MKEITITLKIDTDTETSWYMDVLGRILDPILELFPVNVNMNISRDRERGRGHYLYVKESEWPDPLPPGPGEDYASLHEEI